MARPWLCPVTCHLQFGIGEPQCIQIPLRALAVPPQQGRRSHPAQRPELSHSRDSLSSNKEEFLCSCSWCKAVPLLPHLISDVAISESRNMSWIFSKLHLL